MPPARLLPPGAIRPRGWLADQLRLLADGLTGRLDEVWDDVGPNSAWLGGDGEDWERGPYYLDGLIALAFALDDARLLAKANCWVEAILASRRPDGQFGPRSNDDPWPRAVALKAIAQHVDATDDERGTELIEAYLRFHAAELERGPLEGWAWARGVETLLVAAWLADRTGSEAATAVVAPLRRRSLDWIATLAQDVPRGVSRAFDHRRHVVNVAMGVKTPAVLELLGLPGNHDADARAILDNLDREHGQVNGTFSGDEWLAGREPTHGTELCAVAELMYSLEHLTRVFGDRVFADRLETVAFNALASTTTADGRAHQYHQQANQVACTVAPRDWTFSSDAANTFGFEPHFGCCTANLHQAWPKLVRSLWLRADDGLACVSYAPCRVRTKVDGAAVALAVETDYPFEDEVRIAVGADRPATWTLRLPIPSWSDAATIEVNGEPIDLTPDAGGSVPIRREWRSGDSVLVRVPMRPRLIRRGPNVGVGFGPLVLALAVDERWSPLAARRGLGDWEVRAGSPWNYALEAVDGAPAVRSIVRRPPPGLPFARDTPPLVVRVAAHRQPDWTEVHNSAGPPPLQPVAGQVEEVTLIPYGSAQIRIAEFPVVGTSEA